jgi:BspA type Leucine rich repeat region (6 copies)/Leucine rich repeat
MPMDMMPLFRQGSMGGGMTGSFSQSSASASATSINNANNIVYDDAFCNQQCSVTISKALIELQTTVKQLTAQVNAKVKIIVEYENVIVEKTNKVNALTQQNTIVIGELQQQKTYLLNEVEELKKKLLSQPAGDIILLQKQNSELVTSVTSLNTIVSEKEAIINNLKATLTTKENEIVAGGKIVEQLKVQVKDLIAADNLSKCQTQLTEWMKRYKDKETEFSVLITNHEKNVADLQVIINNLNTQLTKQGNLGPVMGNIATGHNLIEFMINTVKENNIQVPNWDQIQLQYDKFIQNLLQMTDQKVNVKPAEKPDQIIIDFPNVPDYPYPWWRIASVINNVNLNLIDASKVTALTIENKPLIFNFQGYATAFPELQRIIITNAKLELIQENDFKGCSKLTEINLSNNNLRIIRKNVFAELKLIELLDLSKNKISAIENGAFVPLVNLKDIRLNENLLVSINYHIFVTNLNLVNIYLQSNGIILVDKVLMEFLMKKNTDMHNNECIDQSFPVANQNAETEVFCVEPSTKLYCNYGQLENMYQCAVRDLIIDQPGYSVTRIIGMHAQGFGAQNVKGVLIVDQKMSYLPQKVSKHLMNVEEFLITNSGMKGIYKSDFSGFKILRKLVITKNNLKLIENGVFDSLLALEYIDLSENKITAVPTELFFKISMFTHINLSRNEISILSKNFIKRTKRIKYFNISTNSLTIVPKEIFYNIKAAKYIDFTSNTCMSAIIQLDLKNSRTFEELAGIATCQCSNPIPVECFGGEDDE